MNIPAALIAAFAPSEQLLLDVTRRQLDDGMLQEFAEADCGIDAAGWHVPDEGRAW
jgi:hypothetical protein